MVCIDPGGMSVQQRRAELVGLLAARFLRWLCRKGYLPLARDANAANTRDACRVSGGLSGVAETATTAAAIAVPAVTIPAESAVEASEGGSKNWGEKLSESAWFVRESEAQCRPRGAEPTRKGRRV